MDDYLVSNNRCFYAIMQKDGNFVVYRGSGPGDTYGPALWASATAAGYSLGDGDYSVYMRFDGNFVCFRGNNTSDIVWASASLKSYPLQSGDYVALMQDDSNLVVYNQSGGAPWATGGGDLVIGFEANDIQYYLDAAKTLETTPLEVDSEGASNDTAVEQKQSVKLKDAVTQTSSWSSSVVDKVSITSTTSLQSSIPIVSVGTTLVVSEERTVTNSWSGSSTKTNDDTYTAHLTVPPVKHYKAILTATKSVIAVPYTLHGTAILQSGTRIPARTLNGTYTGANSHDYETHYIDLDAPNSKPRKVARVEVSSA